MPSFARQSRSTGVAAHRFVLAVGLVLAGSVAGAFAAPADAAATPIAVVVPATDPLPTTTATADLLPTPQINGVVWRQVIVGNTVYVGGEFTNARPFGSPSGVNTVARSNMLAYNLTTGALDTSFAPTFNGTIKDMAVTPDKTKMVVVGPFTTVSGQTRNRAVVFNLPANGSPSGISISNTVVPNINGMTTSVSASNTQIWFGGWFSAINSDARNRVGAVSATNGSLLPVKIIVDDGQLNTLVLSPDGSQVVLGGNFSTVGGVFNPATGGGRGLYRASTSTGAGLPLPVNSQVMDYGDSAGILRLASDPDSFYGTPWAYGGNYTTEGVFRASWNDGSMTWLEDCHGDSYDAAPIGDVVYVSSHEHNCGTSGGFPQTQPSWTFWHSTAWSKSVQGTNIKDTYGYPSSPGSPRPQLLPFFPQWVVGSYTGQSQATWTVTGNSDYVLYGGEFPGLDGISQQGLARFAVRSIAPKKMGPMTQDQNGFSPTVRSLSPGQVRVSWPALWDRDDPTLTYQLYRNDTGTKIYETTQSDEWQWNGRAMSFTDTTQPAGSTPRYAVRVIDSDGNLQNSGWTTVTVSGTDQTDTYTKTVMGDGATKLWRLDDSGSNVADLVGPDNTTAGTGVTRGVAGAMTNSSDTASSFNGTNTGWLRSNNLLFGPDTFSEEVWFKTTSTAGGKIAGYGDATTGDSSHYDRHLYMDTSGRVNFGVNPLTGRSIISSVTGLNNGQWHQAVATLGSGGQALFIDGKPAASKTTVTTGEHYGGYWRVGGDATWSGAKYFTGSIDDFSVYPTALSSAQVANHWAASGRGTLQNVPPTASFTSTATNLSATLDASSSTDSDGTISSYAWDFGDTTSGTGKSTTHDYTAAGTYPVKLTVTDNSGATNSITKNVTVTAANTAPKAAYTVATNDLSAAFDASTSLDADGTIASYAWDFGDSTSGSGKTPTHPYAASGTYPVKLTVTDNQGAINSVTTNVTVSAAANVAPTAKFTSTSNDLTASLDASTSSDPDGSISSYDWTFGDGSTGTGKTVSHPYASAGTYAVKLTVTDNQGATNSFTDNVTMTAPPPAVGLASDDFNRTVAAGGWGTADKGGPWTISGVASRASVSGGSGKFVMPGALTQYAMLNATPTTNATITTDFTLDKAWAGTGEGMYVALVGRRVGTSEYTARLVIGPSGSVTMYLLRDYSTLAGSYVVPGLTVQAGQTYKLSMQVTGTAPTAVAGKVWKATDAEPAAWQRTGSDNVAAMQKAGTTGLFVYMPGSTTNQPITVSFGSYKVQ